MIARIATGTRIRYSAEGRRVFCTKPVYGFPPDKPEREGVFLGMVTERVGRVLWDDRRSPQYLHIDYFESAAQADGAQAGSASAPIAPPSVGATPFTASTSSRADTGALDADTAAPGSDGPGVAISSGGAS